MKKGIMTGLLTASIILSLAGCGSISNRETVSPTVESVMKAVLESASEAQSETAEETISATETTIATETTHETEAYDSTKRMEAYKKALEDIYIKSVLPDGTELKAGELDNLLDNTFAIYDVDHDGRDELIFEYTETYMAAKIAKIYDYDENSDSLYEEFSEFPSLHFYDNLTITADISHNQGYAGDFWPYTLYRYDSESDTYKKVCFVNAWNKEISDAVGSDREFPESADQDGDGIVYYVDQQSVDEIGDAHPIDKDAYDAWYEENIGYANEEILPFQNLTKENISNVQ